MCWRNSTGRTKKSVSPIPERYHLPTGDYWIREFWSGKTGTMSDSAAIQRDHSTAWMCSGDGRGKKFKPAYLGSDLHISQGMELVEWKAEAKVIQATLRLPRKTSGHVTIAICRGSGFCNSQRPDRGIQGHQPGRALKSQWKWMDLRQLRSKLSKKKGCRGFSVRTAPTENLIW